MKMSDLPPNVRSVKDRHGKVRYRFCRTGFPSRNLSGEPGSSEMWEAHAAVIHEVDVARTSAKSRIAAKPRS